MSAAERFATHPPARLQWHPAHGEPEAADPETFHLHVEFVHAHGLPAGRLPRPRWSARQVSGRHVASHASTSPRPSRTALQTLCEAV
jgi:hypothetical protein